MGVQTTSKEVTPDEYRSAQSENQLDVGVWGKGQPLSVVLGTSELLEPPFENYFGHRTGMLWAEYIESNGQKGVKPPQKVFDLIDSINAFQSAVPGSPESEKLGAQLVADMTSELWFIGTVYSPNPIYHRNALVNVPEFKTWSYEYYRTYPYRATQWFLADEAGN